MTTRKYIAIFFAASTTLTALAGTPLMSKAQAVPVSPVTSDVLVAQTNLLDLLAGQLQRSSQQIEQFALKLAQENSPSSMRWTRAETDLDVRAGVLEVKLRGRAPALIGKRRTVLTIYFKLNRNLQFEYDSYRLYVSRCGRMRFACKRARKKASGRINAALQANKAAIEREINGAARQLLAPFVQNGRP